MPGEGIIAATAQTGSAPKTGKAPWEYTNPKKAQKALTRQELQTLEKSPWEFGLSASEREGMVDTAQQAAGAQAQAAQAELGRQALAGQGFQAGHFKEASEGLQGAGIQAAAGASAQATAMSRALIEQRRAQILGQLEAQAQRKQQSNQFWGGKLADAALSGGQSAGVLGEGGALGVEALGGAALTAAGIPASPA